MAKKKKSAGSKIYDIVGEVIGEDSINVVKYLEGKKNISDFKIAEKIDKDIHEVRNVLYRLYNHNLVSYYRKKDRQKGWYISYWTFEPRKIRDLVARMKKEQIERFRDRLEEEEANINAFFICPKACIRANFDKATEYSFKCPECGEILRQQESQKTIDFLKQRITEIEGESAAS